MAIKMNPKLAMYYRAKYPKLLITAAAIMQMTQIPTKNRKKSAFSCQTPSISPFTYDLWLGCLRS